MSRRGGTRADDPQAQLERLSALRPGRHLVVTCYLKVEPRDRTRGKYLIKVKNRRKAVLEAADAAGWTRAQRDAVAEDLSRLEDYLKNPGNLPTTQGVALFLCGPLDLFEVVPLPRVFRSRVVVDRSPLIRELAALEDEFGRLVTVVADRTTARVFEVSAFAATELAPLTTSSTRGKRFTNPVGSRGRRYSSQIATAGERSYHNRIRQEKARHYEAVAQALFQLHRQHPVHGVVLAGPGTEARAIEPFLHPYVAGLVVGSARLNPKTATDAEVLATTLEVRQAFERESERRRVKEMRDALGTGWAINGVAATLSALARGQVRTLLVDADATVPGFRCGESGRLVLTAADCRPEDANPAIDVVDDAIEEALHQRVQVDMVYEPGARRAIDGLAGLLRFR